MRYFFKTFKKNFLFIFKVGYTGPNQRKVTFLLIILKQGTLYSCSRTGLGDWGMV